LYADRIHFGNPDRDVPDHPFWGPTVDGSALAQLAREDGQPCDEFDDPELIERTADDLLAGRVVGWMDGALEFGPRALGHRSVLAAPHAAEMRDRLNRDVKDREEFRPFAPVVPIEAADRYFELPAGGARLARFMSGVFPVRRGWRNGRHRQYTRSKSRAQEAWQDKTQSDRARQCGRIDRGPRPWHVAKRPCQTLAAAAGRFSVCTRTRAGPCRKRGGTGSVCVLHLLRDGRVTGPACLPNLRPRARYQLAV